MVLDRDVDLADVLAALFDVVCAAVTLNEPSGLATTVPALADPSPQVIAALNCAGCGLVSNVEGENVASGGVAGSPSVQFTAWEQMVKLFAPVVQVKPVTAAAGAAPPPDRARPDPAMPAVTAALTHRIDAER